MKKTFVTSIRLNPAQGKRVGEIARILGVSRNHAVGVLIDNAQIVSQPQVEVLVNKNSSVSLSQGTHAAIGS